MNDLSLSSMMSLLTIFIHSLEEVIQEIFETHLYRITSKNYLFEDNAGLVSVLALHEEISQ